MDASLTPDLSATLSSLGQFYPLNGATEQPASGGGMMGGAGGGTDYSGQFSGMRGLLDQVFGQTSKLDQANSVLGGQINSFGGTLTGVQSQVGGINSQVGDLKNQMNTSTAQTKASLDSAMGQIGAMGTNLTGMQSGISTLQNNDNSQTAYLQRLGAAIEKIKSGVKV